MAAPPSAKLQNLSGDSIMNKKLSDDTDGLLALTQTLTHQQQGVNWITRKGLGIATVKLHIKGYVDSDSITHIDIQNIVAGRSSPTTELRQLDWQEREREAPIFSKVRMKALWIQLADVEDAFLKAGWKAEMNEGGFIESRVESIEGGWVQEQIWGFEGERRYVRRVFVEKKR
ncbi:hypothetical protein OEA41_001476 [Lepraria neglecta]|uniref:Uncharacterized protein n=1 Tax=Lepraria neglecta TaxID=209136 RepID=A0AAD9ZCG2_9LECA|nr:hypothetical protein OEA41_001476 [Lepraria neglecta]